MSAIWRRLMKGQAVDVRRREARVEERAERVDLASVSFTPGWRTPALLASPVGRRA
jgi:hypothetical protein